MLKKSTGNTQCRPVKHAISLICDPHRWITNRERTFSSLAKRAMTNNWNVRRTPCGALVIISSYANCPAGSARGASYIRSRGEYTARLLIRMWKRLFFHGGRVARCLSSGEPTATLKFSRLAVCWCALFSPSHR